MSIEATVRLCTTALIAAFFWSAPALADRLEPHPTATDPCKTGLSVKVDRNTPAANPLEASAVPDVDNVCWTELTGQTATYAGNTIATTCHAGAPQPYTATPKKQREFPLRAPIPCHVDENQAGNYNYYDRLNWSIAAAERLNNWEHHLTPRLPRGPNKGKGTNPCWSDPKAGYEEVVLPSRATCPH